MTPLFICLCTCPWYIHIYHYFCLLVWVAYRAYLLISTYILLKTTSIVGPRNYVKPDRFQCSKVFHWTRPCRHLHSKKGDKHDNKSIGIPRNRHSLWVVNLEATYPAKKRYKSTTTSKAYTTSVPPHIGHGILAHTR
jgi:hypothetical protein